MIDITTETPFPLRQAAKHRLLRAKAKNGRALDFCTLWRWAVKGVRGVKLETVRIGATLSTTNEALERFVERLSDPDATANTPTPSQARRAHAAAERELIAAGI